MKTKIPNIFLQVIRYAFKLRVTSFYSLEDMANDINNLTIKLNISNYHVIGVSMGGMIAQLLAVKHTNKVNSLISIMSTTGDPNLLNQDGKSLNLYYLAQNKRISVMLLLFILNYGINRQSSVPKNM